MLNTHTSPPCRFSSLGDKIFSTHWINSTNGSQNNKLGAQVKIKDDLMENFKTTSGFKKVNDLALMLFNL